MNVTNLGPVQRCHRCGQEWIQAHFCPALNAPNGGGAQPLRQLTEADIRRIVREELERYELVDGRDPR